MREIRLRGVSDDGSLVYPSNNRRMFGGIGSGDILQRWSNVEQWTGLTDENGKDIYEGDIVRCMSRWDGANGCVGDVVRVKVTDVIWNNAELQFQARERNEGITYSHGLPLTWGGWDGFEVVGNIHENPEMLPETAITIP